MHGLFGTLSVSLIGNLLLLCEHTKHARLINDNVDFSISSRFEMATCGTEEPDGSCIPSSCCSTVQITFTDETFLGLYFGSTDPVTAVFAPNPTSPILDFREVYMWQVNITTTLSISNI